MNDWIVANINNPDFDTWDFVNIADMNLENTQLLNKEEYLKSNFILEHPMFKDQDGKFSKDIFDSFYEGALRSFIDFQEDDYLSGPELDMFDTDRTSKSRVKDTGFSVGRHFNPERRQIGVEGINVISDPLKSRSEIAQGSKIWDYEKQEFLDYSPNDIALFSNPIKYFKSIFYDDPLVLAQYEEDGDHIDPITKQRVEHKKGDYVYNEDGTYYYETLGNRSPINKQFLAATDYLTSEDSNIQKYDFIDSDDIEKSIPGIVAKSIATVLPLFTPASHIYASYLAARELTKVLPLGYELVTGLSDSETPDWINSLVSRSYQWTSGTSDYAKQHTFSFENFANLLSDVALQWEQQKFIAEHINKLRGTKKYVDDAYVKAKALYDSKKTTLGARAALDDADWKLSDLGQAAIRKFVPEAEKKARKAAALGRNMSLAYMSAVSNYDVYSDAIAHGADKSEAALVALGSALGMYSVDKIFNLGDLFFDDATDDIIKQIRMGIKHEMGLARKEFSDITKSNVPVSKKYIQLIKTAADKTRNLVSKYAEDLQFHTTGLVGKAIGEGLEETGEELMTDLSKSLYETLGVLGVDTKSKDLGAWDNALDRYGMSFLGGAAGGGLFYAKSAIKGEIQTPGDFDMATAIRNGYANDIIAEVNRVEQKGKAGNKKLSATKTTEVDGKRVWLTTTDSKDSQNAVIAQMVRDKVRQIDTIINNNQIGLSDDDLFRQMVLANDRFLRYKNISGITNYYQDAANIFKDLIDAEIEFNAVNDKGLSDSASKKEQEEHARNMVSHQKKLEEAIQKKDQFLSGDTSLDYTRMLNFAMDPMLYSSYVTIDEEQLWKQTYGDKNPSESPNELLEFTTIVLPKYRENQLKNNVAKAWKKFKDAESVIAPELFVLTNPQFKKWSTKFSSLMESKGLEKLTPITENTKLEGDPEDLNTLTPEQRQERLVRLKELETQTHQEWVNKIREIIAEAGGVIDPIAKRYLLVDLLPYQIKQVNNTYINNSVLEDNIKGHMRRLLPDLSNSDQIIEDIRTELLYEYLNKIKELTNTNGLLEMIQENDDTGEGLSFEEIKDFSEQNKLANMSDESLNERVVDLSDEDWQLLSQVFPEYYSEENLQLMQVGITQDNIEQFPALLEYFETLISPQLNEINSVLADIANNPITSLNIELKDTIENPLISFIKKLAGKGIVDQLVMPDIEKTITKLDDIYHNSEDLDITLDETQLKQFQQTRDALSLINTYLYAASSTSDEMHSMSHNKMFNEFVKNHSDVISKWNELPEIDQDYAMIYRNQIKNYLNHLDVWQDIARKNAINKPKQFKQVDKNFTKSLYDFLQNKLVKISVNVDNKEYKLLEGISTIPTVQDDNYSIPLFETEKLIRNNFKEILKQSGLTVEEFFEKSDILEKVIGDLSQIKKQKILKLKPGIGINDFSDYDKLIYLATILTQDAQEFYRGVLARMAKNKNLAPIISQEYAARITQAANSQEFRSIIKATAKKAGVQQYVAANTVVNFGDAGTGKTYTVAKPSKDLYPEEEILVAGPTQRQVTTLKESMDVSKGNTIEELMISLLGEDQFTELKNEIENAKPLTENKYFKIFRANPEDTFLTFMIKPEAFKYNEIPYKLIVIDEATHMPSIYAQVIDNYLSSKGGLLQLLGDAKQRGYKNKNNAMGNITVNDFFTIRTPELTVSLRDNNIQKQGNLIKVTGILNKIQEAYEYGTKEEFDALFTQIKPLMSSINFRVYNKEEINGSLITKELTPETLLKLNKSGKTIAFISDQDLSKSKAYQAVKDIKNLVTLTKAEMQGQEFDYVIIDEDFSKKPSSTREALQFMQNLYTLDSRGKEATVFIDNGLSNIIGKNVVDSYPAKAPSLTDKINKNKSIIEELQEAREQILKSFDLGEIETNLNPKDSKAKNEEEEVLDKAADEIVKKFLKGDDITISGEFPIMSFGDVTYMNVAVNEKAERVDSKTKKKYIQDEWVVEYDSDKPLRNIQALYKEGDKAFFYEEKVNWQNDLYKVKSMLLYGHAWDDVHPGTNDRLLPQVLNDNFTQKDWEEGKFEVEIRPAENEVTPMIKGLHANGVDGYLVNIVFKVKNKKGQECIFDIAGLNDPKTLKTNIDTITNNIAERNDLNEEQRKVLLQEVENQQSAYAGIFEQWIQKAKTDGSFSINADHAIEFNKTTWFRPRTKPIRLGGRINPNTGEVDIENAKQINPHLVFSNVYTYASNKHILDTIDVNLKGKAVVFVSGDKTLDPNELVNIYIKQKSSPDSHTPVVRMLVLGNYGMRFSDLINDSFFDQFGINEEGSTIRKPVRNNILGIEMFTSLWNFRLDLKKMQNNYIAWRDQNGYSDKYIQKILKASEDLYEIRKNKLKTPANQILNTHGVSEKDIKNLEKFNQEICKDIPTFKLGWIKNQNGFMIRHNDSTGENYIAIVPQKIDQFKFFADEILNAIVPNDNNGTNLGVQLSHLDNSPFDEDEYIDFTQAKHKKTLSGLIKFDGKAKHMTIEDNSGEQLAYVKGSEWSLIPRFIKNLANKVTWDINNLQDEQDKWESQEAYVSYKDDNGDWIKTAINIGTWYTHDSVFGGQVLDLANKDKSLLNFFDLLFHGTTEDIHKKLKKGDQLLQSDHARYPLGFFVNPDLSRTKGSVGDNDIKAVRDNNGEVIFYEINTPDNFFTLDVDGRTAGININLKLLIEGRKEEVKKKKEEEKVKKDNKKSKILEDIKNKLQEKGIDYSDDLDAIIKYNRREVSLALSNLKSFLSDDDPVETLDDILGTLIYNNELEFITVKDHLELLFGEQDLKYKLEDNQIIVNNDFVLDIESGTFSERKKEKEEERSEDYRKRRIVYNGEEMTFLEYINKLRHKDDANKKLINTFIRNDMFKDFLSLDGIIEGLDNLYTMLQSTVSPEEQKAILKNYDLARFLISPDGNDIDEINRIFDEC